MLELITLMMSQQTSSIRRTFSVAHGGFLVGEFEKKGCKLNSQASFSSRKTTLEVQWDNYDFEKQQRWKVGLRYLISWLGHSFKSYGRFQCSFRAILMHFVHVYAFELFFGCGTPTIELYILIVTCGCNLAITKRIKQIKPQCKVHC